MSDEREADTSDTGRGRDVGQGYPEEQPGGAGGGRHAAEEEKQQPPGAPESKPDSDSGPGVATGNPGGAD